MKTLVINNKPIRNYTNEFISENSELVKDWEFAPFYDDNFINPFWNGSEWIENATPEEIAEIEYSKIPKILTPRQFWLSIFSLKGMKKQDALDFIETLPEPPREMAKITLLESNQFEREDLMLVNLSFQFGWNNNDLNEIFKFGATL